MYGETVKGNKANLCNLFNLFDVEAHIFVLVYRRVERAVSGYHHKSFHLSKCGGKQIFLLEKIYIPRKSGSEKHARGTRVSMCCNVLADVELALYLYLSEFLKLRHCH